MTTTVYLVSGANRGIGLGLVTALALRDNVVVFAGARNPAAATDLQELVKKFSGKVHIVQLTSCDKGGNEAAVEEIRSIAGRLDVVIANAGIALFYGSALDTPADQMRDHFEINVVGTLILFQASYPLLKASTPSPRFIPISSAAGSITEGSAFPAGVLAYGSSKAAENYLARKLHFEHEGLICFPMNPGAVATDLSKIACEQDEGMQQFLKLHPVMPVEKTIKGLLAEIDNATREKSGGQFVNFDGVRRKW